MLIISFVKYVLMVNCLVAAVVCVSDTTLIDIDTLSQKPDFPTGCEVVSAVMILQHYGFVISVDDFAENYIKKGNAPYVSDGIWYSSNPDEFFLGDPRSESGWGVWAKGLKGFINCYFNECDASYSAEYSYSLTLEELCRKYVRNNIPVIVWCTVDMAAPYINISPRIENSSDSFTWISPNHCMVLVGYDATGYYFNDPMTGKCRKFGKSESEKAFRANYSQAVVILR